MKKQFATEYEKVLNTLTGGVRVDKDLLISEIHKLREKGGHDEDIKNLGLKLYQILLENGLNESSILNKERLVSKIEVYRYEKRYDLALEIIEVLDSQEDFVERDGKEDIVYFANTVEVEIYRARMEEDKEFVFGFSVREPLLSEKVSILYEQEKYREAEIIAAKMVKHYPLTFYGYYYLALINLRYKTNSSLKKAKIALANAKKNVYAKSNQFLFLRGLSKYFEIKKEFKKAYAVLVYAELYTKNPAILKNDFNRLANEINKIETERFVDMEFEEAKYLLKDEQDLLLLDSRNITIVLLHYEKLLIENFNETNLIDEVRKVLDDICPEALIVEAEKKAKKIRDENKKKK